MNVESKMENYRRAHATQSYLSRSAIRDGIRLVMMEPEFEHLMKRWVYEVLCKDCESDAPGHGG
jgi:hypothetical protein